MGNVHQGEILELSDKNLTILVLSRDFFNASGLAVVCPVVDRADPDALHIKIEISPGVVRTALVEQLKSLDLHARYYKTCGRIDFSQIQDISDAVQGIFDYYPFSI